MWLIYHLSSKLINLHVTESIVKVLIRVVKVLIRVIGELDSGYYTYKLWLNNSYTIINKLNVNNKINLHVLQWNRSMKSVCGRWTFATGADEQLPRDLTTGSIFGSGARGKTRATDIPWQSRGMIYTHVLVMGPTASVTDRCGKPVAGLPPVIPL